LGEKTAQTGVLDPLAEGVIIVLAGPERLKKIEYAGWPKIYEFDILFGITTDSYDGLGLATNEDFSKKVTEHELKKIANSLVGKYTQKVPIYSATKYKGKRLFEYPKAGVFVEELPEKSGEIFQLKLISLRTTRLRDEIKGVINNIKKVAHGKFRQEETTGGWLNYLLCSPDRLVSVAGFEVKMSRGLYVRSLSQDIAASLGMGGFVTKLVRTKNGGYTRQLCRNVKDFE